MSDSFILMSAPNGARRTRDDHPALPIAPAELAREAETIAAAGASVLHLHVRDADGGHSIDPQHYRPAIDAVRQAVGDRLVLQVTTEACGVFTTVEQMTAVRELQPEAVSLALRELCPDDAGEAVAKEFFQELHDRRVMAQYILYSADDVARFNALRSRGVVPDERPFVLLVLGRYSESLTGDPAELAALSSALDDDVTSMVCCFGATEHAAVAEAVRLGGHARVGFENNLLLPDGETAPDNAALVRLAAEGALAAGRPLASADDVRQRFGGN